MMMRSRQHHGSFDDEVAQQNVSTPRKRTTTGGRRKHHHHPINKKTSIVKFLLGFICFVVVIGYIFLTSSILNNSNTNNNNNNNLRNGPPGNPADFIQQQRNLPASENNNNSNEKKILDSDNQNDKQDGGGKKKAVIKEASNDDEIVETLMKLAEMPVNELQSLLEGSDSASSNMFQIDKLQQGICPWATTTTTTTLPWLPKKKSLEKSKILIEELKDNNNNNKKQQQQQQQQNNADDQKPVVAVYYEHLSKAGGTSFCKLAQSNMKRKFVPNYFCMPSKPKQPDARVGSWPVNELQTYFVDNPYRLVSNEWEPFNLEYLQNFSLSDNNNKVQLIFVTSIRNPINRLLSAHKFWGILHNNAKVKPTLEQFLSRYGRRANKWKIMDGDFTANVARFNFATWKFSGGQLPVSDINLQSEKVLTESKEKSIPIDKFQQLSLQKDQWKVPFEISIRTLSNFDLVIPMEEMSNHPQPVTDVLGWNDFSQAHVVPSGKVVNNKASSELPSSEYDLLWQSNSLDMILYYWSLSVYLTRLHCNEYIITTTTT